MMQIIYIAGPITGVEDYQERFAQAVAEVKAAGFLTISPADHPRGLTNAEYMRLSFAAIDAADGVLFLPDWPLSKGATLEHLYCEYTNKPHSARLDLLKEAIK